MTLLPIRHRRRTTYVRRVDPVVVALAGLVVLMVMALAATIWLASVR